LNKTLIKQDKNAIPPLLLFQVDKDGNHQKDEYDKEPCSSVVLFFIDLLSPEIQVIADEDHQHSN